jgi:hypothetical protein
MATIDEGKLFGRGISFPPRLGPDGRWAWSSGAENVRESIRVILLTQLDERLMRPDFGGGLQSLLFEPNTPSTHRLIQERITQALGRWEPRIRLDTVNVIADPADEQAVLVTIRYRLVATGTTDHVGLAVRLEG